MLPTRCGFRLNHVRESANPRASAVGGIGYHHVSDLYIALFTHFVPCGVYVQSHLIFAGGMAPELG